VAYNKYFFLIKTFKGIEKPNKRASGVAGTARFVQELVETVCSLPREI